MIRVNKTNIIFNNKINLKTISPIKSIKDTKNIIKEDNKDSINNIKIKVNKLKLEKTLEEANEKIKKNYEDKSIHSIRRRFMNSKNKHNNNLTPDYINKKIIKNENNIKEKNINNKDYNFILKTEINENPKLNDINTISDKNSEKPDNINSNYEPKKEDLINEEIKLNDDTLKNGETENIPEIKFQSESKKENRMKRKRKYKQEKEKEKESKIICDTKNRERNARPMNKIKKYNSFSFGTLFWLSGKMKQRKNSGIIIKNGIKIEEEKCKNEEDLNNKIKIRSNRNLSPDSKEINKKKLIDIIMNEKEMKIKNINSEKKYDGNNDLNINKKYEKKVTISQEIKIEEINTTKPVVRFKISQLLYYDELKQNQINNDNSKFKKYSNLYIFGFDKNNLIRFDIRKRRFNKIKISDIEDISDSFQNEYIYENTLISNTLTGLFILTGENANFLYYYDKKHEIIIKLCQFASSHNSGCLLLDKNKIFIFSGKDNKICEYYDFSEEKIESIPELNYDRANSSFCFSKDNIYTFFGYSYTIKDYLFNIEYIDKNKLDKWNEINLDMKENTLIDNDIINASLFNYNKESNNIFIYGGKRGLNDSVIEGYYYIYDIEKNNFEKIENVFYNIKKEYKRFSVKKFQEENKKYYFFDKQKQFIELSEEFDLDKNNENTCAIIDYDNNIHFLTKNRNYVNLCQFFK